ncbi:MAG: SDR family oxidoreductase [Pseudomonadota bacterium]
MSRFANKKILVTGGTSGIGLATVERLLSEGAQVAVTGSNETRLAEAANKHPGLVTIRADNANPDSADTIAKQVKENLGNLDGLFLNAGFGRFMPIEDITAEEFDSQYNVNVRGPLLQAKMLSPLLNKNAKVIINTSIGQNLGMAGGSIYNSTKGALRTFVRVLAREWAPRKINVNAVSPGPIGTDFFNRTGLPQEVAAEFAEQIQTQVPLGRFGEATEVAAVAAFLLSDDASYVTGSEYVVDGGMSEL